MLDIHEFSCGYGSGFALSGVTLHLKEGMMAGIIGPNGSGKSTLLKGILGDLPRKSGDILLNGHSLLKMKHKEKARKIAVVAQHIEQVDMRVEDYVLMGRMPYQEPFQFFESTADCRVAHRYMEFTGVMHLKDKRLTELSGGEQQLAAIARALTQEPELLLLDEPTSHLDITHQSRILNLIQHLNDSLKLTVLLVIHDLNLASEYCNHLVLMKNGSIQAQGIPAEVLTYSHIESVYQTVVITLSNPLSGRPAVFMVSEKILKESASDQD